MFKIKGYQMKLFLFMFFLLVSTISYATEFSETEMMVQIIISYVSSMLIPVVALIFILIRRDTSIGKKALWSFVYFFLWYVLGRLEFILMLLAPEWGFYIQITLYILITALFVSLFYKFTKSKKVVAEDV